MDWLDPTQCACALYMSNWLILVTWTDKTRHSISETSGTIDRQLIIC